MSPAEVIKMANSSFKSLQTV